MVKQKTPKGSASAAGPSKSNDSRFSNFNSDPRFRLPSKKQTRTTVDKRFSRMLKDEEFANTAKVDRYGRKLSSAGKKKVLERLYVPDENESTDEDDDEGGADIEVEDDDVVEKELKKYDAARGGGFSSSDDDSDSDSDEEEVAADDEPDFPGMAPQRDDVEGEVTTRIAAVNMDWDNIRAVDLLAVFQSFVPTGGSIKKISVYQSEFGKERMEREEIDGPPKDIFAKKDEAKEESSDSEDSGAFDSNEEEEEDDEDEDEKIRKDMIKEDDGKDFDSKALRQYQVERLRYHYAVIECSDKATAENIYSNVDGKEYLSSANIFDLSFIPEDMIFEDSPRDESSSVPADYIPNEFKTDALTHSKVRLTWDQHHEEAPRKELIKRGFTGSKEALNNLKAYVANDSDDSDDDMPVEEGKEENEVLSKKEQARLKIRALFGLPDEPTTSKPEVPAPVGGMEITFSSALTADENTSRAPKKPEAETTAEAYIRKEKERKARKKEMAKAIREGRDPNAPNTVEEVEPEKQDLGFDDPFFADDKTAQEKASRNLRKEERKKKREAKDAEAAEKASKRAELELLMQENSTEDQSLHNHFDINEIARVEKKKKKKGKYGKDAEVISKRGGMQEGFELDVQDPRFAKVFESHEFAIDTSNPRFKKTEGMQKLLQEGRKRRGAESDGEIDGGKKKKKSKR